VKKLAKTIMAQLPRRRRRMWKYVSPQRRRNSLILLALLLTMLYAWWHFTRAGRIRREAKKALESLTGCDVDVVSASFSLFEGVRLNQVRMRIRDDDSPQPFFKADQVVLKHRPWSLLFHARLEPTEIHCIDFVLTQERDKKTGKTNFERMLELVGSRDVIGDKPIPLPRITLTDGILRSFVREGGLRIPTYQEPMTCTLTPVSPTEYELAIAETRQGKKQVDWARLRFDVVDKTICDMAGTPSNPLIRVLPGPYHEWIRRYHLQGEFRTIPGPNTNHDKGMYEIELEDFSLKLPPSEGGMTLSGGRGTLLFSRDGVVLKDITGRVNEAGGAAFSLSGHYRGYKKQSPFEVEIVIHDVALPDKVAGATKKVVGSLHRQFKPHGKADLKLAYQRDKNGKQICEGVVRPKGASMTYEKFPLPVSDVRGSIYFDQDGVNRFDLTAERDKASYTINGTLRHDKGFTAFDVRVAGVGVLFDSDLRDALPGQFQSLWERLSPTGRADIDVHVFRDRPEGDHDVEVDMIFKGFAAVRYKDFPYPLENLSGQVLYRDNTVTISHLQSRRGAMRCKLKGTITDIDNGDRRVDLTIAASRVPLDEALFGALNERTRKLIVSLSPRGQASRVDVTVHQAAGKPLEYTATATLRDVSFCYEKFPYKVSDAAGRLVIDCRRILIQGVKGRHGGASVQLDGRVGTAKDQLTYDLTLDATAVPMDKDFAQALPKNVRKIWANLNPAGLADMNLRLIWPPKTKTSTPDFRLLLNARNMQIRYKEFPYTFRGVTGKALVTPGRVELIDMHAAHGKMTAAIGGVITTDQAGCDVEMKISAKNLPVDEELLAAIPPDILPLAKRVKPGGYCDMEIDKFTFKRAAAASQPASRTATQPGEADKTVPVQWNADGKLAFRDVSLDFGFGPRVLTGSITGQAGQNGQKLGIDALVKLKTLALKHRNIIDVQGRLTKHPAGDVLQIDGITGKAHGGRVAGTATIRMGKQVHYGMSLAVDNIDMAELVNADQPDRTKWSKVSGRLAGRLDLSVTAGPKPDRQAIGSLTISRAKMYKLPVILGLLNVIYLTVPGESAFNSGVIKYHLKNDTLLFREIFLTGNTLSVLGSGTLNMKTDALKLTFLTAPPGKLPRLSGVTDDVLRALSKELVEIRVKGTLKEPEMETVNLRSIHRIIRRLFTPGPGG